MPAGDLISADYQLELRATLNGEGTAYRFGPLGIDGIDVEPPKTQDVPLDGEAGAQTGYDYPDVKVITVDYTLKSTTAGVGVLYKSLRTLWAIEQDDDIPLHIRLPGLGQFSVMGRPRGLRANLTQQKHGLVTALATFVCGDPTMTDVP